ncbi:hypothetical protein [Sphingobacterium sp. BIGb0116]|uniref:hypothetical protein n=1 Tax=Sphingobacterium sp. BIGb0116 TaxID=2940619 RepID=UPI00216857B4|nr:hypothetical protein [Sphingobacterium sp. BIGb0116]MCS4168482.1 hypothetical protein [Sphingobacterium sp. BIGb0116]
MKKFFHYYLSAIIGLAFAFCMLGCSKENSPGAENVAKVQVILGGIDNKDIATLKASKEESVTSNSSVQIRNIKLGEDLYLQARLSKVGGSQFNSSSDIALKASGSGTKAVVKDVVAGVKYKVMVYDSQRAYVDEAEYTAGGSNTQQFTLVPNKQYSFICYSLNGTDPLPWVSNVGSSLAEANLALTMSWTSTSGNDDLLYTRIDKTVVAGMNVLDILFKHKFTEITTKVDASAIGPIVDAELYFGEIYKNIDVDLESGALTYKGPDVRKMVFPAFNLPVITSRSMTIARPGFNGENPYPGSALIRKVYGNIKIGNVEKYFEVPELAVEPGERYSLDIVIKTSPDQVAGLVWAPGNLKYDGASYSFSYTNGLGSYFPFGHLYPYGMKGLTAMIPVIWEILA